MTQGNLGLSHRNRWSLRIIGTVLVMIAVARIASTFRVFSATTDEATHVGAGLELLQFGTYTLQPANPPLPRLILALPLYLDGVRVPRSTDVYVVTGPVFFNHNAYEHNLILARAPTLVFFVLAAFGVWLWATLELGDTAGLLALLLFSMEPIVLGYSGLATHDGVASTGIAFGLVALTFWLREPSAGRASILGVVWGLGIASKFSCLVYIPLACAGVFIVRLFVSAGLRPRLLRAVPQAIAVVLLTASLTVWASYGFTVGKVANRPDFQGFNDNPVASLTRHFPLLSVPAPAFFAGIGELLQMNRAGMVSYALGRTTVKGWWWYFPFAMSVKTSLPLLVLLILGVFATRRAAAFQRRYFEAIAAAVGVLLPALTSTLDIGVRYVLPAYVPLAFAAAASLIAMRRTARWRLVGVAVLVCDLVVSVAAHPDYFPYFNQLAGPDPGALLVDSNLDWGQDVLRLRGTARRLHVERISMLPGGFVDYPDLGFPPIVIANEHQPSAGWIAVSEHYYRIAQPDRHGWSILARTPFQRVGKSLRLYHIAPSQLQGPTS